VDSIDSISSQPHFPNPQTPLFHVHTQIDPALGRASLQNLDTAGLLVTAVMTHFVMVVADCGIRGDNRAGHNRKRNSSKQQITEHLHDEHPLPNPAAHPSGRSGQCKQLIAIDSFLP
jgi:hypothetical protein